MRAVPPNATLTLGSLVERVRFVDRCRSYNGTLLARIVRDNGEEDFLDAARVTLDAGKAVPRDKD